MMIVSKDEALIFLHQVKCDLKLKNSRWLEILEKDIKSIDTMIQRISELDNGPLNLATLVVSLLHYFRADLMTHVQAEFSKTSEKVDASEKPQT